MEDESWFIPSVIKNALLDKSMELTDCEQKYDYLHVNDLTRAIMQVAVSSYKASGVYNLSSNGSTQLRTIIEKIQHITQTKADFKFGALPYRKNQVMHMEGDSEEFFKAFNFCPATNMDENIEELVRYYKQKIFLKQ